MSVGILSIANWLHLLATVIWIGGMATNTFVVLPAMSETLEPAMAGKFMGSVMKRFRRLIYASMIVLGVTGFIMTSLNANYAGAMQFGNLWSIIGVIKHIVTAALIVVAIYAFEGLAPKVARQAASGPSPELARLRKLQTTLAGSGFLLGIVILFLTGVMSAISSTS